MLILTFLETWICLIALGTLTPWVIIQILATDAVTVYVLKLFVIPLDLWGLIRCICRWFPTKITLWDWFFTNIDDMVFKSPDEILREIETPHPPATFCVSLLCSKIKPSDCVIHGFKNADYLIINDKLNSVNWAVLYRINECEWNQIFCPLVFL